jgi:hypothetical protein
MNIFPTNKGSKGEESRNNDEEGREGRKEERLEGNKRRFCGASCPIDIPSEVVQAQKKKKNSPKDALWRFTGPSQILGALAHCNVNVPSTKMQYLNLAKPSHNNCCGHVVFSALFSEKR